MLNKILSSFVVILLCAIASLAYQDHQRAEILGDVIFTANFLQLTEYEELVEGEVGPSNFTNSDVLTLQPNGSASYNVRTNPTDNYLFVKPDNIAAGSISVYLGTDFQTQCVFNQDDNSYYYNYYYGEDEGENEDDCIINIRDIHFTRVKISNTGSNVVHISAIGISKYDNPDKKVLEIHENGIKRLNESSQYGSKSVTFVTVMGKRGTGKSTIASLLAGDPNLFLTGTRSIGTTTEGIHISPLYNSYEYGIDMQDNLNDTFPNSNATAWQHLYFLDTEGMGIFGTEQDMLMVVPLAVLSKTLIWVASSNIQRSDELDDLEMFVDAARRISNSGNTSYKFESLIYVVNKMQGDETDDQLTKELFSPELGRGKAVGERNRQRRKIRDCFRTKKAIGLPYLRLDPFPDVLTYAHFSPPNERFRTGLSKIVTSVLQTSKSPKLLDRIELNGDTITSIVNATIENSNTGRVFISNVAIRASIRLWAKGILNHLTMNISVAVQHVDTFINSCHSFLANMNSTIQTRENEIPRTLSTFWKHVKYDTYSKIECVFKSYFKIYIKLVKDEFVYPNASDCPLMHFSMIRCQYESCESRLNAVHQQLLEFSVGKFPDLASFVESQRYNLIVPLISMQKCADIRALSVQRTEACVKTNFLGYLKRADTHDIYRIIETANRDFDQCISNGASTTLQGRNNSRRVEVCSGCNYFADIAKYGLRHKISSNQSISLYYQTLNGSLTTLRHTRHLETLFNIEIETDNVKTLGHIDCHLNTLLDWRMLNEKDIDILCFRSEAQNIIRTNAKSVRLNALTLDLENDIALVFDKPPKPRKAEDGLSGSRGIKGSTFKLNARNVNGQGIFSIDAPGGDGGDGGNGRDGRDGENGRDGSDGERKAYYELDVEYQCEVNCHCIRSSYASASCFFAPLKWGKRGRASGFMALESTEACCLYQNNETIREIFYGSEGTAGTSGQRGGNAARGGRGGDVGDVLFSVPVQNWGQMELITSPGTGGRGGTGGAGGLSGLKGRYGKTYSCVYDLVMERHLKEYHQTHFSEDDIVSDKSRRTCDESREQRSMGRSRSRNGRKGLNGPRGYFSNPIRTLPNNSTHIYFTLISYLFQINKQDEHSFKTNLESSFLYVRNCEQLSQEINNKFTSLSTLERRMGTIKNTEFASEDQMESYIGSLEDALADLHADKNGLTLDIGTTTNAIQKLNTDVSVMVHEIEDISETLLVELEQAYRAEYDKKIKTIDREEQERKWKIAEVVFRGFGILGGGISTVAGAVDSSSSAGTRGATALGSILSMGPQVYLFAKGINDLTNSKSKQEFKADRRMARLNMSESIQDSHDTINELSEMFSDPSWIENELNISKTSMPDDLARFTNCVFRTFGSTLKYGQNLHGSGNAHVDFALSALKLKEIMIETDILMIDVLPVKSKFEYRLKLKHLLAYAQTSLDILLRSNKLQQKLTDIDQEISTTQAERNAARQKYLKQQDEYHNDVITMWSSTGIQYLKAKKRVVEKILALNSMVNYIEGTHQTYPAIVNHFEPLSELEEEFENINERLLQIRSSVPHTLRRNITLDILEYPDVFYSLKQGNKTGFSISNNFDVAHQYWVESVKIFIPNLLSTNGKVFTRLTHPGYTMYLDGFEPTGNLLLPEVQFESMYVYDYGESNNYFVRNWPLRPNLYYDREHDWVKHNVHTMWQIDVPRDITRGGLSANRDLDWSRCRQIQLMFELSYYR